MKKYYFTFGLNHPHYGYCQPIVALNLQQAEKLMFLYFGNMWAFGYPEDKFNSLHRYKELNTIYAYVDITAGEMKSWTDRLNQILGGAQRFKNERLATLMTDLERTYNIPMLKNDEWIKYNPIVYQLYRAVSDAREFSEKQKTVQ